MPMLALDCRSKRDLELNRRVRATARKQNRAVADILRAALEQYYAIRDQSVVFRKPRISGAELARRLDAARAEYAAKGGKFLNREELDAEIDRYKGRRD